MNSLEMELEVKAYVRHQQWSMDYYMTRNNTCAPKDLSEQKRKEIRKEVIREYKYNTLKALQEIL